MLPSMLSLYSKSLLEIIEILKEQIDTINEHDTIAFEVYNPDKESSSTTIIHSYKTWVDLAQLLKCKMLTPQAIDEDYVVIRYKKLSRDSFHAVDADKEEKYGADSIFAQINKNEETSFIYHYAQALKNVKLDQRVRVLNLGVNNGDEFEVIEKLSSNFENIELLGIDYCASAIEDAKEKFQGKNNVSFMQADINELNSLELGEFDLIISIGTLQSSNLNLNKTFMSIVQNQLSTEGALILAFPNCRWIDGEMIYGAMMRNYNYSEMSNLYKDVVFCKKYLQQKKFRVTITGKDYIFLTATSIRK
ncbi:methyltransferase domain-containing protein [Sulfurimonas microaerophilic]|uniref:methyltransferase domain-containing protein n=1 Tax=Sulfurimonas microaerophilic TaxID=3058392 RepID=UPI0027152657|nr:methyltransferase domain-containing protein [Sulfurimonas sp. hsl 1-7]